MLALVVFSYSFSAAQSRTAPQVALVPSSRSDHRVQTVQFESKLVGHHAQVTIAGGECRRKLSRGFARMNADPETKVVFANRF